MPRTEEEKQKHKLYMRAYNFRPSAIEYRKKYYQQTREKQIAYAYAWQAAHPDRTNQIRRMRRVFDNEWKEKINMQKKKSYLRNKKTNRAWQLRYLNTENGREISNRCSRKYSKTPNGRLKRNILLRAYRAKKYTIGRNHTVEQWLELRNASPMCPACGRFVGCEYLTADHIIPISKGGGNNIENIQSLCQNCNSKKSNVHYPKIF